MNLFTSDSDSTRVLNCEYIFSTNVLFLMNIAIAMIYDVTKSNAMISTGLRCILVNSEIIDTWDEI